MPPPATYVDLAVNPAGDTLLVNPAGDTLAAYPTISGAPGVPPDFGVADFVSALLNLMPRGPAWPKDLDAIQTLLLQGLASMPARLAAAAKGLIRDAFPATTVNLLANWEASLGLPDPCAGPAAGLSQRQSQVVTKFAVVGSQSVPYFVNLAASLGYPVTITEFTGGSAHNWTVNAPTITMARFRTGQSGAGEPLILGGNAVLECVFRELKPTHTVVNFVYS